MAIEIEHKYIVVDDSYKSLATSHSEMSQGYLNRNPERTVRIRVKDNQGFITVKGKNKGDSRLEFEYEVPVEDAKLMLDLCEPTVIRKTRWNVPFGGFIWEVDEFHGSLSPLVVAEIEIPSSDTEYPLPGFVGENVTGDARYYNSTLSSITT